MTSNFAGWERAEHSQDFLTGEKKFEDQPFHVGKKLIALGSSCRDNPAKVEGILGRGRVACFFFMPTVMAAVRTRGATGVKDGRSGPYDPL